MWGAIGGSVSVGTTSLISKAATGILSKVGVQKGVDIATDTAVDIARDISSGGKVTVTSVATSLAINTITAGNSNGAVNKSQIKGGNSSVKERIRNVSADGKRSIRFGPHEMDSKPSKFHYHEEIWTYDPIKNVMNVDNTVVRMPYK